MTDCDAVVIGSGSGGLTAALALAHGGRRVAVFEQHYLPGGYSQSFTLQGYQFSPGIHYIGELGPGERLRHIYEGLGVADDLVFLELNPDGYDHVVIGDQRFDIPKGIERFRERLKTRFPSEAAGIDGYLNTIARMSNELRWAVPPTTLTEALMLPGRLRTVLRHGLVPLNRFLDRFTRDPLLRAVLSIQAGDHGMAPSRAPTALHAGLQGYYFNGGCYPRGGGHAIPEAMIARLERLGGTITLRREVAGILVENGKALGVRLADGTEVRADIVISNADPGVTWGRLVEERHLGWRLRRRIHRQRYSVSTLSLFMAVDMDVRRAGLDSGNVWFSQTPDIDAGYRFAALDDLTHVTAVPGLFLNVTTLKDPSLRTDGVHTVEAISLASPDAFARWKNTARGARPPEYRELKARLTDAILVSVERCAPGLREHVVFRALATPLTNIHFLHATRGGIYGTEKSLWNLGPFGFPVRTSIQGLYQCGASTIAPGIHGVTESGLAAAAAALGCAGEDLLPVRGQHLRVLPAEDPASWPEELRPGRPQS